MPNTLRAVLVLAVFALTSGCIGTVVGQTTSAEIEVAKVSYNVGGSVIDVANGGGGKKKNDKDD